MLTKVHSSTAVLFVAGVLVSGLSARADITPGTSSAVTLALTASYTEDASSTTKNAIKTSSGSIQKMSYGNAGFLNDLLEGGHLPDTTINGWRLVLVNRSPVVDVFDRHFYVVKEGKTPVSVEAFFRASDTGGGASAYKNTRDLNDNLISGTSTFRQQFSISGVTPTDGAALSMVGVVAGGTKSGKGMIGTFGPYLFVDLLTSAKVTGIVGSLADAENPEGDDLLIEGSISFGKDTAIDISGYPEP